jgi:hypothetical protein
MFGSGPLEEGHVGGGRTLEESNYKYAEDLRYDIQQVPHPTQPRRILLGMLQCRC